MCYQSPPSSTNQSKMYSEIQPNQQAPMRKNGQDLKRKLPARDVRLGVNPISNANIRSRFFWRLGIEPSTHSTSLQLSADSSHRPKPSIVTEPLKTGSNGNIKISPQKSSPKTRKNKSRSVSFDNSVSVCQIPRKEEYSDRIRNQFWSGSAEIQVNASRNAVEFSAENWDWRQAVEDKDMILTQTGDLIHPIHYMRQCRHRDVQRHFLEAMAARQAQSGRYPY